MVLARVKRIARTMLRFIVADFRNGYDAFKVNIFQGRDAYNQTKAEILARQRKARTDA
jgi:hypothetical protein